VAGSRWEERLLVALDPALLMCGSGQSDDFARTERPLRSHSCSLPHEISFFSEYIDRQSADLRETF
jgi:hypothetical protein